MKTYSPRQNCKFCHGQQQWRPNKSCQMEEKETVTTTRSMETQQELSNGRERNRYNNNNGDPTRAVKYKGEKQLQQQQRWRHNKSCQMEGRETVTTTMKIQQELSNGRERNSCHNSWRLAWSNWPPLNKDSHIRALFSLSQVIWLTSNYQMNGLPLPRHLRCLTIEYALYTLILRVRSAENDGAGAVGPRWLMLLSDAGCAKCGRPGAIWMRKRPRVSRGRRRLISGINRW